MGFEVDFLAVGEGKACGDAIALRYGNLDGSTEEQFIVVIDGGTTEAGNRLVKHIKELYNTNRVNLVISTHPDADHSSGLCEVLENLEVDCLWLHKPWEHSENIESMLSDGRITEKSIEERFRKSLENAYDLNKIAARLKIPVTEPFVGLSDPNGIIVLGPTVDYYEGLLPSFRAIGQTPEQGFIRSIADIASELIKTAAESLTLETLSDKGETSSENNSSVIILVNVGNKLLLFTGDAGIPALSNAMDNAGSLAIDPKSIDFMQIPHHGSKRNIGPTILNRILGPKNDSENKARNANVSAPKNGFPKHPSKKVLNAYTRRNARVFTTMGSNLLYHSSDAPTRAGWESVEPLNIYAEVEE